ncbi:MAG: hypothetical protein NC409_12525 [Clostridium sp.]|nr:hypothetical protein [Clostridium sp.]
MKDLIINTVTTAGAALVATALVILIKKGCSYMDFLIGRGKTKAKEEGKQYLVSLFEMAEQILEGITKTTVSKFETTKAAALREAVHAGQKTAEELHIVSDEAYREIVEQLSPVVESALEDTIGNVETYIRNKIEEVLPEVKQKYRGLTSKETGNETGA